MANEVKKTPCEEQRQGPKVVPVTWFATHESLMNPGLPHITSYMQGNLNMNGNRKFDWTVGSNFITTTLDSGHTVVIPIVNLKSFSVLL